MHVPGKHLSNLPILNSPGDYKYINYFLSNDKYKLDFISVPGVQTGKDIMEVRDALGGDNCKV